MPSSLNGTGVTFNDGTTLNSANDAGGNYIMRTFTAPTTWTKPAGLKAVKVTVVAGGGGGGGGRNRTDVGAIPGCGGSGGGGGGAVRFLPAPSIPGPVAVTVGAGGSGGPTAGNGGAGGTSSYGPFLSATGGAGGTINPTPSPVGTGGAGGAGSSGDYNSTGSNGGTLSNRDDGGFSLLGTAPATSPTQSFGNGITPINRGGGGGGGSSQGPGPARTGAAGQGGIVLVEEFY